MRRGASLLCVITLPPSLVEQLDAIRARLHAGPNAVLPFVGSGLSRGLLSWTKLIEQLIAGVDNAEARDGLTRELAQEKYLEVAGDLEREVHRARMSQAIEAAYRRPKAPRPPVYERIAALPVTQLATTNYDPWLKDAVAARLDEQQEIFGSGGAPRHWFLGVGLSSRVQGRLLDRGVMPVEYGKVGDYALLGPVLEYLAVPPDGAATATSAPSATATSAYFSTAGIVNGIPSTWRLFCQSGVSIHWQGISTTLSRDGRRRTGSSCRRRSFARRWRRGAWRCSSMGSTRSLTRYTAGG